MCALLHFLIRLLPFFLSHSFLHPLSSSSSSSSSSSYYYYYYYYSSISFTENEEITQKTNLGECWKYKTKKKIA